MRRASLAALGVLAAWLGACTFGSAGSSGTAGDADSGGTTGVTGTSADVADDTGDASTDDGSDSTGCVSGTVGCDCNAGCEAGLVCMQDVCVSPTCGNGTKDTGEVCDDGNLASGDGCEGDCTFTPGIAQIRTGRMHTCARRWSGEVYCFGEAGEGRLGYGDGTDDTANVGDDETPARKGPIELGGRAVDLCTAGGFSCAILEGGDIRCWGAGAAGHLGNGQTDNFGDDQPAGESPSFSLGLPAVRLGCGHGHACAIREDGALFCWGNNGAGRLGYGMGTSPVGDDEPVTQFGPIQLGAPAAQVCGGEMHTCVRLTSGGVMCFGEGDDGRLGYGDSEDVGDDETPVSKGLVPIGESVVEVDCGGRHTCVRLDTGDIKCWGDNDFGQLGDGTTDVKGNTRMTIPSMLDPIVVDESVLTIGAGSDHTCAVLVTGRFKCWGDGTDGRLASGAVDELWMPPFRAVAVDPLLSATSIDGGDRHACARVTDGSVRCWGASDVGQTGYGSTESLGDEPDETPDLNGPVPL